MSFELDRRRSVELAKEFVDERYPGRHELVIGNSVDTVPAYADEHESLVDGRVVDVIKGPGDRAWAAGRHRG